MEDVPRRADSIMASSGLVVVVVWDWYLMLLEALLSHAAMIQKLPQGTTIPLRSAAKIFRVASGLGMKAEEFARTTPWNLGTESLGNRQLSGL